MLFIIILDAKPMTKLELRGFNASNFCTFKYFHLNHTYLANDIACFCKMNEPIKTYIDSVHETYNNAIYETSYLSG